MSNIRTASPINAPLRSRSRSFKLALKFALRGQWEPCRQQLHAVLVGADSQSDYALWRLTHGMTPNILRDVRQEITGWKNPPRISIFLRVDRCQANHLDRCLLSVIHQLYPNWELCVTPGPECAHQTIRKLWEYAGSDARIKLVAANPVSLADSLNAVLPVTTGSYLMPLDPTDTLAEHAMYRLAKEIIADDSPALIYSDEDTITDDEKLIYPFFKPAWSPEYLLGFMYTGRLAAYRIQTLREMGGYREQFTSAAEYDLVLRMAAKGERVAHIPDILYHRAPIQHPDPEPAERALAAYGDEIGFPLKAEPGPAPGLHAVRFEIRDNPLVSIVIPSACREKTFRGRTTWFVLECVTSIRRLSTYKNIEIIVLDNGDIPPRLADAMKPLDIRLVPFTEKFNLTRKINLGASAAKGDHLILLNDDIEVITPDWIERMLEYSQQPHIGAVGAMLLFPDDTQQHVGVTLIDGNPRHPFYGCPANHPGYFYSSLVPRNFSAVTGACVTTRAAVYKEVGGFSREFPLSYNDIDYCLKVLKSGKRIVQTPFARLYHHETVSRARTKPGDVISFKKAWQGTFPQDIYYNPNLNRHFQVDPL